mmetsp:Transcript_19678/g.46029  ORF Transcript_19678/g.46029 Transcript_19678/m.46029 type:complete len:417 (+) Transcript_19678:64-1314(+)
MPPARAAAISSAAKKKKPRRNRKRARGSNVSKATIEENIGCCGSKSSHRLAMLFARLRDAGRFQGAIIGVIFVAGALVGIQTYPLSDPDLINVLDKIDTVVLIIFIFELVVKFMAEGKRPHYFFKDAWNIFDFLIVVVGLMPFGGSAVTALRLVRLLRVLKLVRALPRLRILVMGLLKSMSSIAYIGLLLMLLFYLYAVLGVSVFGKNDPVHMGTLHIAFLTLFRCATLEDWTDVMYIAMEGCENYGYDGMEHLCVESSADGLLSVTYFCSFIILSSMMILNLFIGVITSSMQDAKSDLSDEADAEAAGEDAEDEDILEDRLDELGDMMRDIADQLVEMYATHETDMAEMDGTTAEGTRRRSSAASDTAALAAKVHARMVKDELTTPGTGKTSPSGFRATDSSSNPQAPGSSADLP